MLGVLIRSATVLALAILVGGPFPVRADHGGEDERPDLKIELVGLPLENGQREVQVRVTNASEWWANETKARIETVPRTTGDPIDVDVENLDPGQSVTLTYTLAAACDGRVVKVRAEVFPAGNYEDVLEGNLDNNSIEGEACTAPAGANDTGVVVARPIDPNDRIGDVIGGVRRPGPVVVAKPETPENQRPGTHTLVLQVGRSLQAFDSRALSDSCTLAPGPGPAQDFWVGWGQLELTNSDPCHASVVETAVLFDTGPLDEIPVKDINRAVLTYDEAEGQGCYVTEAFGVRQIPCWRSGTGFSQQKPAGCVGALRMPTVDWLNDAPPGLIPYITPPGVRRLTPHEWDVSEDYRDQYTRRAPLGGSALPPFGFLLAGGPSLDDLTGEDSTSCYSWISNIRLHVTYTVPPDSGRPSPIVR